MIDIIQREGDWDDGLWLVIGLIQIDGQMRAQWDIGQDVTHRFCLSEANVMISSIH
jgi:hypothetical protein